MNETLTANGLDLLPGTKWCWVESMAPLMTSAPRRGSNVVVPGRHGVIRTRNKRHGPAALEAHVWVFGVDPVSGLTPDNSERQLHDNIDKLWRVFNAPTVLLTHSWDGVGSRSVTVELATEPVEVPRERSAPAAAKVVFPVTAVDAFWADSSPVTQTVTGTTGKIQTLDAFVGATAPMSDLQLTAYGPVNNPAWEHGEFYVQYQGVISSGRQLVLNTSTWQVTTGTGSAWSPDLRQVSFDPGPVWFELDPSTDPFTVKFTHTTGSGVSATSAVIGTRKYLGP